MIKTPSLDVRPVIRPLPQHVFGLLRSRISLDGIWSFARGNYEELIKANCSRTVWQDITVPCDLNAYPNLHADTYVLQKEVNLPNDYANYRLFIRFEASQGLSIVYVDGHEVGRHAGGFLDWDCEITSLVTPGRPFKLAVAFPERDEVGTGSGGLIRSVYLCARPSSHITRLHTECSFDAEYTDACLTVIVGAEVESKELHCRLNLIDPAGADVPLTTDSIILTRAAPQKQITIPIKAPQKWDAEHPHLYILTAFLYNPVGELMETIKHRFGFRQVEITGNELLVNGVSTKLRGVCRHDYAPNTGHSITREQVLQDILLFKEANCNYIRTSHYPPSTYFLELCDEYGIYVEDEIGFAFIGRTLRHSQKAPDLSHRYLHYFASLIERDRSHPSVIIWSIANESFYGPNFALCNAYAKQECPNIPTKFSYPMTMQEEDKRVGIWSVHYANYDSDLGAKLDNVGVGGQEGRDMPVLHDEFAHVPCYNRDEHRLDPAVRAFYGQSIEAFWNRIWNTPGALGGAIWAGIDVADCTSGLRLLEWGIIDGWRRRKPEHFGVRRAYSPVKLVCSKFVSNKLFITVENRFNHTNLTETCITWNQGSHSGVIRGFDVPPRSNGTIVIDIDGEEPIVLRFQDPLGFCVEEMEFHRPSPSAPSDTFRGAPMVEEDERAVTLRGAAYSLSFSKVDGLIRNGQINGEGIITGGPFINMVGVRLPAWTLKSLSTHAYEDRVDVWIQGSHGENLQVTFRLSLDNEGLWETYCILDRMDMQLPWEMKIRVGVHTGGLNEFGVFYTLCERIDALSWIREGQNACWPKDHIARRQGVAPRETSGQPPTYGKVPRGSWSMDTNSYFLFGRHDPGLRGTNDFRSSKHEILEASALIEGCPVLTASSDGCHSVRMEVIPHQDTIVGAQDIRVKYEGVWHEIRDDQNRFGAEVASREAGASAQIAFEGTGIVWHCPVDTYYGSAVVYLDGKMVDSNVSLRVDGVEFPGASMGFDKRYQKPVCSVLGLKEGPHLLQIKVKEGYVSIDYFRVIQQECRDEVKFIVNSNYNYPKLAWGNRMRPPVLPKTGDSQHIRLRLGTQRS